MPEVTAVGYDALELATRLLQRARLVDDDAGIWEAADLQWWTRRPRRSDDFEQLFWLDDDGPLAGIWLTTWDGITDCQLLRVPGAAGPDLAAIWERALHLLREHAEGTVEVAVQEGDTPLEALLAAAGLRPGAWSGTASLDTTELRPGTGLPDGYTLVDRTQRPGTPHPMRLRNGEAIQERLARCSLYDPSLDLSVEAPDGEVAGYALFWSDTVTRVGEVEPVRVQDDHQRRGLATALVHAGVRRLADRGARLVKIGYGSEAALAVYERVGFRQTSMATSWTGVITAARPSSP